MKVPRLEKIMQFKTSFLNMLTRTARDLHVKQIVTRSVNPDKKKFAPLSKKYKREKAQKYNSTKPNLMASGQMFNELQPQKPQKIGSGVKAKGIGSVTNIILTYGIKSSLTHKRNKGTIKTGELMNLHQNGTENMPKRDITGDRVLHDVTLNKVVDLLVNQINKNIRDALHPKKTNVNI